MFGGIPAFGGHSLAGSIERGATLTAKDSRLDIESETFFVQSFVADDYKEGTFSVSDVSGPLTTSADRSRSAPLVADISPTLRSGNMRNNSNPVTEAEMLVGGPGVRRLTPCECERLQGMPDDYTLIPWRGKPAEECPDGPRYKAIGNSKAVPCVRWIGRRILKQIQPSPYS
jgi:DNA (cytosine-5)-methyltransferase 1